MATRKSKLERVDSEFIEDMEKIAKVRLQKGLAKMKKNELSYREMTNLLRKTNGYKISLEELKIKPKKRK